MTALSTGAFVFLDEKGRLLLLARGANREAHIIYGGDVLSFAVAENESVLALAFPPAAGKELSVVRLYAFSNEELMDALAEVEVKVTQLLWVGTRHLVTCSSAGCTIYTWDGRRLKFFVSDTATSSLLHASCVGLMFEATQTLQYWSLEKNRMLDSIKLSLRGRRLVSVSGAGYFGFALYDDGSVSVFYMLKGSIKKLEMFERLFSASSLLASLKSDGSSPLLARALSSRKVLLGLRGDDTVHKLEYKNEKVLVNSMQDKLPFPFALLAISCDGRRCLAFSKETGKYHALVLSFCGSKALGVNGVEKSNAGGEREGSKKANATLSAIDGVERRSVHGADENMLPEFVQSPGSVLRTLLAGKGDAKRGITPSQPFFSLGTLAAVGGAALVVAVFVYRFAFR